MYLEFCLSFLFKTGFHYASKSGFELNDYFRVQSDGLTGQDTMTGFTLLILGQRPQVEPNAVGKTTTNEIIPNDILLHSYI